MLNTLVSGAFYIQRKARRLRVVSFCISQYSRRVVRKSACVWRRERKTGGRVGKNLNLSIPCIGMTARRSFGRSVESQPLGTSLRTNLPGTRTLFRKYLFRNDRLLQRCRELGIVVWPRVHSSRVHMSYIPTSDISPFGCSVPLIDSEAELAAEVTDGIRALALRAPFRAPCYAAAAVIQ